MKLYTTFAPKSAGSKIWKNLQGKEFKIDVPSGVDVNDLGAKLSGLDINKEEEKKEELVDR